MIYLQCDMDAIRGMVFIIFMAIMGAKYIFDCFTKCPWGEWDFEDAVRHLFTRAIIVCIVYFVFM